MVLTSMVRAADFLAARGRVWADVSRPLSCVTQLGRSALFALTLLPAVALGAATANAELQSRNFKVVGTWGNLSDYFDYEKPLWEEQLPKASGGKITGGINPITELGLKGWEVMRLQKLGVFDATHGVYGYVASEQPALEGIDLSAAAEDYETGRKIVEAYEPVLRKTFDETFNAHYLTSYPFPSQFIFCAPPIKKLTDLRGKKVRVYSTTLGDFVEAAGGTSVTIAFAEVVPALQRGVADCGITGSMPAYQANWHEVVTHAMIIRVGMGMSFLTISKKAWNSMNAETRAFMEAEIEKWTERTWKGIAAEDSEALDCLSGRAPCARGEPGNVTLVQPSEADLKERERILREAVLKNWAERCSDECVRDWNETVAPIIGVKAGS